jgi:hypothetical protein
LWDMGLKGRLLQASYTTDGILVVWSRIGSVDPFSV